MIRKNTRAIRRLFVIATEQSDARHDKRETDRQLMRLVMPLSSIDAFDTPIADSSHLSFSCDTVT